MAALTAGDRAPILVRFRMVPSAGVDGLSITSAVVMLKFPGASTSTPWTCTINATLTTAVLVVFDHVLATDGSDAITGKYRARAWLSDGPDIVDVSEPFSFKCDPQAVAWPS